MIYFLIQTMLAKRPTNSQWPAISADLTRPCNCRTVIIHGRPILADKHQVDTVPEKTERRAIQAAKNVKKKSASKIKDTTSATLSKDQWIQKAKALLFDCGFCLDSTGLRKEADSLIKEGGGYDPLQETCRTPLRWTDSLTYRPLLGHAYKNKEGNAFVAAIRSDIPPNPGMRPGVWYLMVKRSEYNRGQKDHFYWIHSDGRMDEGYEDLELADDLGPNAALLN